MKAVRVVLLLCGSIPTITIAQTTIKTSGLTNAVIDAVVPGAPKAEVLAFDAQGIITAVEFKAEVLAGAGPNAGGIDLYGQMVLPGFQDAHWRWARLLIWW